MLASISKTVTSIALMQGVESATIDLDESINSYFGKDEEYNYPYDISGPDITLRSFQQINWKF